MKKALRPSASSRPVNRPIIEATKPVSKPSSRTDRRTCLREAPSVRNVASSRTRCARFIDSVLKMTKPPTSRAMKPNAKRRYWMILIPDSVSLESAFACSWPVRT